jgi:DNA-binding response OmpR family regulator
MTLSSALAEPQKADFDRATRELRQSALGLAQAWQALSRAGWSTAQLRPVLLALRHLGKGCDRLRLASLRKRTNDLETQLVPFLSGIDLTPHAEQARAVEAGVSALTSSVLAIDLSQALPGYLLANAANDVPPGATESVFPASPREPRDERHGRNESVFPASPREPTQISAEPTRRIVATRPSAPTPKPGARISDANTVVVLRAEADLAAGLVDALKERGHRILELSTTQALEQLLSQTMPGAVIADARFLNGISRQLSALKARAGSAEVDAAVVVISDRRDLGRRLLATRHGAVGYFEEPIDVLEVSAVLSLRAPKVAPEPTHRALLCTHNLEFAQDCGRWLMGCNITTRIEANVLGALAACLEYGPEVLLIDASLKQDEALRLVTELRRHARHVHLPVVLFAGANSLAQRETAIAAGADEYLIEPVKQRHLVSVVSARLERLNRMRQSGTGPKSPTGMLSRSEFLAEYARQPELALLFIAIDQTEALTQSFPISAFDQLDAGLAALLRPRLKSKELLAYFQDGHYLLGVRVNANHASADSALDEMAEKIRRGVEQSRIDLGNGPERLSASVSWLTPEFGKLKAGQINASHISALHGNPTAAERSAGSELRAAEHALHQCRHAARTLQAAGGNRVRASNAVELAQPSNKNARADVPTLLRLQPLLCAAGKLHSQYLTRFVWQGAQGDIEDYARAAALAAASGHSQDFDRRLLMAALNRRAEELKRGRQVRLLMQIGEQSLLDGALCIWLTQQLNNLKLSGSGLSLFIDIDSAHAHPSAWQHRVNELHSLGMRMGVLVGLGNQGGGYQPSASNAEVANVISMLAPLQFDFAILADTLERNVASEQGAEDAEHAHADRSEEEKSQLLLHRAQLLRRVRERGAVSMVLGVDSRVELDQLKAQRVDFVTSERLGPTGASADFDFTAFARQ